MHDHLNEFDALERVLAGATTDPCGECAQAVGDLAILAGVLQTTAQRAPEELRLRPGGAAAGRAAAGPRSWLWSGAAAAIVGAVATYAAIRAIPDDTGPAPSPMRTRAASSSKPAAAMEPLTPAPCGTLPAVVKAPMPTIEPQPAAFVPPPMPPRDARDVTEDGVVDVADARKIMMRVVEGDAHWSVADVQAIMRERVSGRR